MGNTVHLGVKLVVESYGIRACTLGFLLNIRQKRYDTMLTLGLKIICASAATQQTLSVGCFSAIIVSLSHFLCEKVATF